MKIYGKEMLCHVYFSVEMFLLLGQSNVTSDAKDGYQSKYPSDYLVQSHGVLEIPVTSEELSYILTHHKEVVCKLGMFHIQKKIVNINEYGKPTVFFRANFTHNDKFTVHMYTALKSTTVNIDKESNNQKSKLNKDEIFRNQLLYTEKNLSNRLNEIEELYPQGGTEVELREKMDQENLSKTSSPNAKFHRKKSSVTNSMKKVVNINNNNINNNISHFNSLPHINPALALHDINESNNNMNNDSNDNKNSYNDDDDNDNNNKFTWKVNDFIMNIFHRILINNNKIKSMKWNIKEINSQVHDHIIDSVKRLSKYFGEILQRKVKRLIVDIVRDEYGNYVITDILGFSFFPSKSNGSMIVKMSSKLRYFIEETYNGSLKYHLARTNFEVLRQEVLQMIEERKRNKNDDNKEGGGSLDIPEVRLCYLCENKLPSQEMRLYMSIAMIKKTLLHLHARLPEKERPRCCSDRNHSFRELIVTDKSLTNDSNLSTFEENYYVCSICFDLFTHENSLMRIEEELAAFTENSICKNESDSRRNDVNLKSAVGVYDSNTPTAHTTEVSGQVVSTVAENSKDVDECADNGMPGQYAELRTVTSSPLLGRKSAKYARPSSAGTYKRTKASPTYLGVAAAGDLHSFARSTCSSHSRSRGASGLMASVSKRSVAGSTSRVPLDKSEGMHVGNGGPRVISKDDLPIHMSVCRLLIALDEVSAFCLLLSAFAGNDVNKDKYDCILYDSLFCFIFDLALLSLIGRELV